MTKTSKIALSVVAAGVAALSAQASPIVGSVSFNGSVSAFVSTTGTGTLATDYTQAHSVVFTGAQVSLNGALGSFSVLAANTPVSMYSPLQVNPPALPVPAGTPLWQVTGGGTTFTFVLTSLVESGLTGGSTSQMTLTGTGVMSDGTPADSVVGSWIATFTSGSSQAGVTFSWNSSAVAQAPDTGTSVLLLGLGLTALGAYSMFRKQNA